MVKFMRLTNSEHELIYLLSNIENIIQVVPVKTADKRYILIILENGDYWKLPWTTTKEVLHSAYKVLKNYAVTREGDIYFLPTQFH